MCLCSPHRVSLFLAEGIQLQSGKLVMASCIDDRVGLVRSFGADGKLESEEKLQLASQQVSSQRCQPDSIQTTCLQSSGRHACTTICHLLSCKSAH